MAMKRGRGMAAGWYGIARTAAVDRAGTWAEIDDGGTVKISTGVTEIGEGILTVLSQIAPRRSELDRRTSLSVTTIRRGRRRPRTPALRDKPT